MQEQVNKLQSIQSDVFSVDNKAEWETCFSTFTTQISDIEQTTVRMIDETFKNNLNSSIGAFDLLDKFKHVETRKAI